MADANLDIRIVTKSFKQFQRLRKEFAGTRAQIKLLDTGIGSMGNRLGFVAFQFTFLAGIAGRALGEITNAVKNAVRTAAKGQSLIIRAIAQSGIDITNSSEETVKAIEFMNNAMRTMGSGTTIFSVEEVAGAYREVAKATEVAGSEMDKARAITFLTQNVITPP